MRTLRLDNTVGLARGEDSRASDAAHFGLVVIINRESNKIAIPTIAL